MKIRILKEVPVAIDNVVHRLKPGTEIDTLNANVVASLLRGGDAEEVHEVHKMSEAAAARVNESSPNVATKWGGKKNRGAAPENK